MTKLVIPKPTQWIDPLVQAPPPYVHLLVRSGVHPEFEIEVSGDIIHTAFYSTRAQSYVGIEDGYAMNERLIILGYHVITDANGESIPIYVPSSP